VCKIVGTLDPSDYPISLDVEFPGEGQPDTGMTPAQLLKGVLEAWQILKDTYGVAPLIYTSARVWLDDLKNPEVPAAVKESLLWLARYAYSPGPAVMTNVDAIAYPPVPPPWAGTDPKPITYRGMPYSNDNWFIHQYMGNAVQCPGFPTGNVDMNRMRPLQKGSTGERVKWLQRRLGLKQVDGKFGPQTDKAVRDLQAAKNGLVSDGIVGPRTYAYLCWLNP
jgi:GH25 family lysozyme M1 (1,4-beta-N-acetylmuramidase)